MKITNMMRFILIYGLLFWATLASANTWTIAIDPGHGGKDPGAIGRNLKIYEKKCHAIYRQGTQSLVG